MLKTFTFSLSKNTELPASLYVFLGHFLSSRVFSLCLDEVLRGNGRSFPNVVEIPPNPKHQENNVFFHIHEINSGSCVVY